MVELQDSAYPYHDWNERITAECYGPNAVARILGPDGRWLPECAVDTATLEVLAAHGIRFAVLTSTQAARVRPRQEARSAGDGAPADWQDVSGGRIDPTRAYLQRLPSGRSIALFFT